VVLTTEPWIREQNNATMKCGPHQAAHEYQAFLHKVMADFVK
jgi:hypothetical protein